MLHSDPDADDLTTTSVVLRLAYGTVSLHFTGDVEAAAELDMVSPVRDRLNATMLNRASWIAHLFNSRVSGGSPAEDCRLLGWTRHQ